MQFMLSRYDTINLFIIIVQLMHCMRSAIPRKEAEGINMDILLIIWKNNT
jgi:hypothetical protein